MIQETNGILPLRTVRFDAPRGGAHLAIFGAVHGNEVCGARAIEKIVPQLASGDLPFKAGRVTFIPVCNPWAYARDVRYVDHNLNRDLRPREKPEDYEDRLANVLCDVLQKCDYLLDLHAYNAQGPAFIFAGEESEKEIAFRRSLGPTIEMFGWTEAYVRLSGKPQDRTAIGTTEYARQFGAVANTLECGYLKDPKTEEVAALAIRNALAHCGLCDPLPDSPPAYPLEKRIKLEGIYRRADEGRLAKAWGHLEPVKAGEALAFTASGEPIVAPGDGFIIFPNPECLLGDEWFYFGQEA